LYQNACFSAASSMEIRTIRFGDEGEAATRELLRRFDALGERAGLPAATLKALRAQLATLESLDRQYGGMGPLALEDLDELVASILTQVAVMGDADLVIGVALWAIRHDVGLDAVEPVANALAQRSNRAANKQELAAAFGLMQGVIAHVAPLLSADLERSNPERPWRILHANLAITAIRSEDPALMDFAFDALDRALPDERAGFYSEALALALAPGIAPAVRERIAARHSQWTAG
jgi:hypothetical protein